MEIIETILIIIGGIATLGIICFFVYMRSMTYKQEEQEQDERIQLLERRLEDYRSEDTKEIKKINTALKSLNEGMNKNYLDIQKQLKKKGDK